MTVLAAAVAAAEPEPAGEDLGLCFVGVFQPSQSDWRAAPGPSEPAPAAGDPAEDPGLAVGYLWGTQELGSGELDALLAEDGSLFERSGLTVGRSTALRDGGIDGARSSLGGEQLAGYAEPGGEFDLYDISMRVGSIGTRRMGVEFITGFRAVEARVGRSHSERTDAGDMQTTLDLARGVVTIPIIGTGVHWQPSERVRLSGSASTHTMHDSATFYDLTAEAEIQLRPNVGFVAGYQYVRSAMEVRAVPAELDEEGLYARIQIRF
jgi:hypothetical protein